VKLAPVVSPVIVSFLFAVAYATTRGHYITFYSRFGTTPEDVGFSQQQLAIALIRLGRVVVPFWGSWVNKLVVVFTLVLVWQLWGHLIRPLLVGSAPWSLRRALLETTALFAALLIAVATIAITALPHDLRAAWASIEKMENVYPSDFTFISVQASRARVIWLNPDDVKAPPSFPSPDKRVMYLGHDNHGFVIHDPSEKTTWRVPMDKALARLEVE
jgi:hypothetical protein